MSSETKKTTIARSENPDFIRNPTSGRFLRKGSKLHRQLVADGLMGRVRCVDKMVAEGTLADLKIIKSHLEKSPGFDTAGERLVIKGGKLYKIRKQMDRDAIVENTVAHSIGTAVQNRKLMGSKLSDDQLASLLMKVANARIIGSPINLEKDFEDMMRINERPPSPTPAPSPVAEPERSGLQSPMPSPLKLVRQIGQYTTSPNQIEQTRRIRKKRFQIMPAPVYDTTEYEYTTAGETEAEYDTEISD
jgi:hypothetical protein